MVQVVVERIDGDPVQDPLLAWHRAVAPHAVVQLAWEPPSHLKGHRKAPANARVVWFRGDDAFIATRRLEPIHGIDGPVVVGLVTPRVRDWKPGWQPVETVEKVRIPRYKSNASGPTLPSSAAVAIVPGKGLIATLYEESIWYDLDRAADWLKALSRDRETTQRLDPIAFPALVTAITDVCMTWDPTWWMKKPSSFAVVS